MTNIGVVVIDAAPAVRSVLRRAIREASGLEFISEATFPSDPGAWEVIDGTDVLVVGMGRRSKAEWAVVEALTRSPKAVVVVLVPPAHGEISGGGVSPVDLSRVSLWSKPSRPDEWKRLCAALPGHIRRLAAQIGGGDSVVGPGPSVPLSGPGPDVVAIGGSAGGPEASAKVLAALGPALCGTTVLIVQHIGEEFVGAYLDMLRRELRTGDIGLAMDGEALVRGTIRVAPPGSHLEVVEGRIVRLKADDPGTSNGHCPSVDRLFLSLAARVELRSVGVLLSGMGMDGVAGLKALKARGAETMVQDRDSCTVWGMPGAALRAGASETPLPPKCIGEELRRMVEEATP